MEKLLSSLRPVTVTVGIHDSDASRAHSEGQTIGDIATAHEFGEGVPLRSWLRAWVDEQKEQLENDIFSFSRAGVESQMTSRQVGERLALRFAGLCKKRIADTPGNWPPNAPSTIAKKGSSKPLIDKGIFRSAIVGKVNE